MQTFINEKALFSNGPCSINSKSTFSLSSFHVRVLAPVSKKINKFFPLIFSHCKTWWSWCFISILLQDLSNFPTLGNYLIYFRSLLHNSKILLTPCVLFNNFHLEQEILRSPKDNILMKYFPLNGNHKYLAVLPAAPVLFHLIIFRSDGGIENIAGTRDCNQFPAGPPENISYLKPNHFPVSPGLPAPGVMAAV